MNYLKKLLWAAAFCVVVYAQYSYIQDIATEYKSDQAHSSNSVNAVVLAKSVESFPDHSEITLKTLKH